MLLGNPDAAVAEQNGDLLHRNSLLQQFDGECVPEPVRVATLDLGLCEHLAELAAPEIAGRLHAEGMRAGKQVLTVPRLDRSDQAHHKRRERHVDVGAAFLRVEEKVVLFKAFEGEHRGIADAQPGIPEHQYKRDQVIIRATLKSNLPANLHNTFDLRRLKRQLLGVADIGWSADESGWICPDPVVLAGESEECLDAFEFFQRRAWTELPGIAELTERLPVELLHVQKAFLGSELLQVAQHQAILAKGGLAEPPSRLCVFEEVILCLKDRDWLGLHLLGQRVPRTARLCLRDPPLGLLPIRSVEALAEETIAALAFYVDVTGAAPVRPVVFRFLPGTARPVEAEDAEHTPIVPERGTNLLRVFVGHLLNY